MKTNNIVTFQIGSQLFALSSSDVAEILPLPALSAPSPLPGVIAGFIDLGKDVASVLKLDRLLDIDGAPPNLYSHLLRLSDANGKLALLVDRVLAVRPVSSSDMRPIAGEETFRGCVLAQFSDGDRPVHLLSPKALLSNFERDRIQSFHDAEARRRAEFEERA